MKNVSEKVKVMDEVKFIPKKIRHCRYCSKMIEGPNYFYHSECLEEIEAATIQEEFITF